MEPYVKINIRSRGISFFYKNKLDEYKKIDLIAENSGQTDDSERKQIFSQIIQGKISASDYLFAGTSRINNYFTPDRLQKIISARPPRQGADHLQRVLSELKSELSFGGIIVYLQKQLTNTGIEMASGRSCVFSSGGK